MKFAVLTSKRSIITRITEAKGDGIGTEIMDATLAIILAAGAKIEIYEIEVGKK